MELLDDKAFHDGAMRCVRCSICVPHCPSYASFKNEADSPRGRVQLMRAVAEKRLVPDATFELHMDNCLGCRACEDVCPSAVPFGELIDRTHAALLTNGHDRARKGIMRAGLSLLGHRRALLVLARLLWFAQWLRLDRLARWLVAPFSRAMARRIDSVPRIEGAPFEVDELPVPDAPTTYFLSGCIMAGALGDVQRATLRVLERSGHRVATPAAQTCCGALHLHAGMREAAIELARANLDAFPGELPICVNSAGCALAMKEYAKLLPDDPRAAKFAARIRDVSELVAPELRLPPKRVAVQEACHHHNVQRLRGSAAGLINRLGGTAVPLARGAGCCGSAGLWSASHPEQAWQLLTPLLDAIERSKCDVVVSSNPGCLLFLRAGLRERGSHVSAVHLTQLLDAANTER